MSELEVLAWGYGLIEGPCVDDSGALFFSDVHNGGVYRLVPSGEIETVIPKRRGVGGIALHSEGGLVVSGRNVCHVRGGVTRVLLERSDVGGFNDLTTDALGRVYVGSLRSDPFDAGAERIPGDLHRLERGGAVTTLYSDVQLTNGLGVTPDGRRLLHADTGAGQILVHDLANGGAFNRRVFAEVPELPDGLAVDISGGIWVALYGGGKAQHYDAEGRADISLAVPSRAVTSVCFGGEDMQDLYIVTADNTDHPERGGTVFRTRVDLPGLPLSPAIV